MKKRAVFLDRDGTINHETGYLHRVEDLLIFPGVGEGIRKLKDAGYLVVVVSNQSGVARGMFGIREVDEIHDAINSYLKQFDTQVDAYYFCPHHPQGKIPQYTLECNCRKPQSGMFLQAQGDLNIDMKRSFAVGDRIRDLQGAISLGARGILVLTGYGMEEFRERESWSVEPVGVFRDFPSSVSFILSEKNKKALKIFNPYRFRKRNF